MSGFFVPHDIKAPIKGAPAGPLAGLRVAVKDMFDIKGERAGAGNPDWLAQAQPATAHAAAVEQLLAAGATITGKTICDEFFYSVSGINAHYGTPANLRAPGRIPGGSSSGSAAAAAAGACDIALGSDTGGSVRVPAALCGLYGIRTTLGRVDKRGAMDMSPAFDTIGWFSAVPGLFRRAGAVLLGGQSVSAPIEKLVVAEDCFHEADGAVASLLRDAIGTMTDILPQPFYARLAPRGLDRWRDVVRIVQAYEVWQVYGRFVEERLPRFGPGIAARMRIASQISHAEASTAQASHDEARAHIRALVPPGTLVVLPTAPCIAPRIDTDPEAQESYRVRVMRLTCIAGLGGLPQITIPVGIVHGCPVGLSFIGWPGGDEALLDLAVNAARHCGLDRN